MRQRLPATLLCLLSLALAPAAPADPEKAAEAFGRLLAEHWARAQEEQVFFRTDPDAFRPNGALPDVGPEGRARRQAFNREILERLGQIDGDALRGQDRLSYHLFRYERETEAASYSQPGHRFPITALFGFHSYFADAPANMDFSSVADYERLLESFRDYPRYNRQQMANLQEGIDSGYTQHCTAMAGYERTISRYLVEDPADSALYEPFTRFPQTVPARERERLAAAARAALVEAVLPAYAAFLRFYEEHYAPACREAEAITSLPGGDGYYRYLVRYYTTTAMTPREIHELGLSETKRIRAEMDAIIDASGFEGDFRAFLDRLRDDPASYAASREDLLEKIALIAKTMDGMMPRFFGRLPRMPYTIREAEGRGAFYASGTADGRNPGVYFVNATDYEAKPLYTLEALTLHEAVPGHHHQMALALELDLPPFRRTLYHAAFGEGWGLYAESLGKEAGFYKDPRSDFGRLTYEMWRANRLVVDTGLHAFGWTRREAIDFMLANSALTAAEITAEVDRYITWPAQALAYKVGELRIQALRDRAEAALGDGFDLRAFHDLVVGNGSLPIALLEDLVKEWIDEGLARAP
ncbi:MAG: DUF885 domain-containing protein [Pseudohaliea sp.]